MLGHRRLGRGTGRQCTPPCVTLPTNPAPYTIVEWGIRTARYILVTAMVLVQERTGPQERMGPQGRMGLQGRMALNAWRYLFVLAMVWGRRYILASPMGWFGKGRGPIWEHRRTNERRRRGWTRPPIHRVRITSRNDRVAPRGGHVHWRQWWVGLTDKRITDNGLRITGLTEVRGENDWNRTAPGVGDQTRLSGGESFCLCVCLGGTSRS